jgi:hypothetical protein
MHAQRETVILIHASIVSNKYAYTVVIE